MRENLTILTSLIGRDFALLLTEKQAIIISFSNVKLFVIFKETAIRIPCLVQDCSNSITNALELQQSCTKPSKWSNPRMGELTPFHACDWLGVVICMLILSTAEYRYNVVQYNMTFHTSLQWLRQSIYRIMYVLSWWTVYVLMRVLFWCLFSELRSNEGDKHQNNTRVSALTVRHKRTYIILFLILHKESINDAKNEDLHTSSQCLTCSLYVLLMTS